MPDELYFEDHPEAELAPDADSSGQDLHPAYPLISNQCSSEPGIV